MSNGRTKTLYGLPGAAQALIDAHRVAVDGVARERTQRAWNELLNETQRQKQRREDAGAV